MTPNAGSGNGALATVTVALTGKVIASSPSLTNGGVNLTGGTPNGTATGVNLDAFTSAGTGCTWTIKVDSSGVISGIEPDGVGSSAGYNTTSVITLSAADINGLALGPIGTGFGGGPMTFTLQNANLESAPTTFVVKDTNTVGGGGTS